MRVSADLGCIRESKMLPRLILDGNTTVRWSEEYALFPVSFQLPDEGSRHESLSCPICGEALELKLVSVARLHLLFTLAFWFVTAVVAGLGVLLYLAGQQDATMRTIGLIVFGIDGLLLLGTLAFMFSKPDYLARFDGLQITKDVACESNTGIGFSGRKGHKLFKIRGGASSVAPEA